MSKSVAAFTADPQPFSRGLSISIWMNLICTKSGGTTLSVGRLEMGVNLISSLAYTSVGAVLMVGGGDVRVVGKGDVIEDVGG